MDKKNDNTKNFYFVPTAFTKQIKKCKNGKFLCGIHAKLKSGKETWIDRFDSEDALKDLRKKLHDDIDNKKQLHAFGVANPKYHSITAFVIDDQKPRTKSDKDKKSSKSDENK